VVRQASSDVEEDAGGGGGGGSRGGGGGSRGGDDDDDDDAADDDDDGDGNGIEAVERTGAFGSYGQTGGRMSVEDDEWATSTRTWASVAPYLHKFRHKKVWAPFYYDGAAGRRLKEVGFTKVVHTREDFFKRIKDGPFVRAVGVVLDNP